MWVRRERQAGAGALEYIGAICAAGVLIAGLAIVFPDAAPRLTCKVSQAIATITGGSVTCSGDDGTASDSEKAPPADPCTRESSTQDYSGNVSILFVTLGNGMTLVQEKLSDDSVRVTLSSSGKIGLEASSGGAKVGDVLNLEAKASIALEAASGMEYTFKDDDDAADFVKWAQREFDRQPMKSTFGFLAKGYYWAKDKFTGDDYKPPQPSAIIYEGGVVAGGEASAKASAGIVEAGASAGVEAGAVLGVRLDQETGDTTTYTKVNLDGQASANVGLDIPLVNEGSGEDGSASGSGPGLSASGGMEMMVETTRDADGNVTNVGVTTTTAYDVPNLSALLSDTPTLQNTGKTTVTSFSFPVDDSNRDKAENFLWTMAGVGSPTSTANALPWAMEQAQTKGDVTMQALDGETDNLLDLSVAIKAPGIGGFGADVQKSVSSTSVNDAWYLGNSDWIQWESCTG